MFGQVRNSDTHVVKMIQIPTEVLSLVPILACLDNQGLVQKSEGTLVMQYLQN